MLKRIFLGALMAATAAGFPLTAKNMDQNKGGKMNPQNQSYQIVNTQWLLDAKANVENLVIVDSRTKPYDDGRRISGALYLPADASDQEITALLPDQYQPIVVYCWSASCPASTWLIDRLVQMGYKDLYKYPEGLSVWIDQNLPIVQKMQPNEANQKMRSN